MKSTLLMALCVFFSLGVSANSDKPEVRLKDLVEIKGVRSNQLTGVGLVVGLPGTGDSKQSIATNKAASNLLTRLGVKISPQDVVTKNIAVVLVTAELPAFSRIGDTIDIRLSSVGDSASLEGGTLVFTPLTGADDKVYAVAQGSMSQGMGMAGATGGSGSASKSSAPKTVALAGGATVEREFEQSFVRGGALELSLREADFTTATRVVKAINENFSDFIAEPINAGQIRVRIPASAQQGPSFTQVAFVSALEQIKVEPDTRALVVINERTGTVISGRDVIISPVAISHGGLEITVEKKITKIGEMKSTTVGELVSALNRFGAGPRDLIAIMQALSASHALKAELKFM